MWNIKVYSRRDFIADVVRKAKKPVLAISISEPWDDPVDWSSNPHICGLHLAFEDTDCYTGMSKADARNVAEFVIAHKDNYKDIAVHCAAGISRSAGVAAAIMRVLTGSDAKIFDSRKYCPNMRCYHYTHEALWEVIDEQARSAAEEGEIKRMTYRQKAEQLLMEHLGVSEDIAPDIVRLLEQEGEYIPAVFGVLNVSYEIEDWDAEIPKGDE